MAKKRDSRPVNKNHYAVIMAGGTGTRLWPLSRKEKPKQFQRFTSSKTMIQETYDRVVRVVPKENIFISTADQYKDLVRSQLPEISDQQLVSEPMPRGTAPAIALAVRHIFRIDPRAIIATIASDHAIKNVDEFISAVSTALVAVENNRDKLVTIGINPTCPDTQLGYIKMGKEFPGTYGRRVFYVDAFKEKPDRKTAERYLSGWEYLWNAGYFIFSADTLLGWVKRFSPRITKTLDAIDRIVEKKGAEKKIAEKYKELENDPIDLAIVEKLGQKDRLVIPTDLEWSDVGNWGSLFDFFKDSLDSSMIVKGNHIDTDSKNCFVYGQDKLIATVGLKDTIIVETDDAILIADRNEVKEVKKIIDKLKEQGKHLYL